MGIKVMWISSHFNGSFNSFLFVVACLTLPLAQVYIFDRPGMCGQRFEVRSDVLDATSWELQETISIRVVRGG